MAELQKEIAKIRAGALGELSEAMAHMKTGIEGDLASAGLTDKGGDGFYRECSSRGRHGDFHEEEGKEAVVADELVARFERNPAALIGPECVSPPSLRRGSAYCAAGKIGEPRRRCASGDILFLSSLRGSNH